jgi:hypothetical protein
MKEQLSLGCWRNGVGMNISKLSEAVIEFFEKAINQKCRILSIMPKENEWEVICEVNIDPDYTTRRGMGDIVEIYEVHVNNSTEILGFSLKETKRKAALDNE